MGFSPTRHRQLDEVYGINALAEEFFKVTSDAGSQNIVANGRVGTSNPDPQPDPHFPPSNTKKKLVHYGWTDGQTHQQTDGPTNQ